MLFILCYLLVQLIAEVYEMLAQVDAEAAATAGVNAAGDRPLLHHAETLADLLYHAKYMWVGDGVKAEAERVVRNLRCPLLRSRYIPVSKS